MKLILAKTFVIKFNQTHLYLEQPAIKRNLKWRMHAPENFRYWWTPQQSALEGNAFSNTRDSD